MVVFISHGVCCTYAIVAYLRKINFQSSHFAFDSLARSTLHAERVCQFNMYCAHTLQYSFSVIQSESHSAVSQRSVYCVCVSVHDLLIPNEVSRYQTHFLENCCKQRSFPTATFTHNYSKFAYK